VSLALIDGAVSCGCSRGLLPAPEPAGAETRAASRWQFVTWSAGAGPARWASLVLAAAIPTTTAAGAPFPGRDMIIAITYAVILVTLLGQGFHARAAVRWLEVRETGEEERREEIAAGSVPRRRAGAARGARDGAMDASETLAHTRDRYLHRTRRLHGQPKGRRGRR